VTLTESGYPVQALWFSCFHRLLTYWVYQSVDFERICWRLLKTHRSTKLDIYVFFLLFTIFTIFTIFHYVSY